MRRALAGLVLAGALTALQASEVAATNPAPAQCSSASGPASPGRLICPPDPNQAVYDQLKARLGNDAARALDAQRRLSATLDQYTSIAQGLSDQVAVEEAAISNLEDQIAKLETQIQETQDRIAVEKEQLAAMVRAIYRQPSSLWVLIARTGNLQQALLATSDMVIAGQRAHSLQARLELDLKKLEGDRKARQDDLDREDGNRDLLVANINALQDVMSTQSDISAQLTDVAGQLQDAQTGVRNQSPDAATALAQLLEAQVQSLVQKSYQTAWIQARVGTGKAVLLRQLPLGKTINGLRLSWPMASFQITQPFGPSEVALEPPLGPYRHFHYGVDCAAPLGTSVMAAADGVVVAVGHSAVGYGNYVAIGHGAGITTLYGHLLDTTVSVGDGIARGQQIGHEGSTGLSTGPHVHFELRLDDQVVDPMPYLPLPGTSWHG